MRRSIIALLAFVLACLPAHSDLMLTGVGAGSSFTTPPATITFGAQTAVCASTSSTCTASAQAIGTADPARLVVVYFNLGTSLTVSSVTIGGVTATQLINFPDGTLRSYFYSATVPTGTTANFVVNYSGTTGTGGVPFASWSLYNLQSTTPIDAQGSFATPGVITLNTQAGGVAMVGSNQIATSPTIAFSNFTQNFNANTLNAAIRVAGGSLSTSGTTRGETATYGGTSPSERALIGVSFR